MSKLEECSKHKLRYAWINNYFNFFTSVVEFFAVEYGFFGGVGAGRNFADRAGWAERDFQNSQEIQIFQNAPQESGENFQRSTEHFWTVSTLGLESIFGVEKKCLASSWSRESILEVGLHWELFREGFLHAAYSWGRSIFWNQLTSRTSVSAITLPPWGSSTNS